MLKILVALFAVVIAAPAYAASATPESLCSGQPCSLPKCNDLNKTKGPYYGWSVSFLHAKGVCRMLCGPHPCVGAMGAWNNGSRSAAQPASQHRH